MTVGNSSPGGTAVNNAASPADLTIEIHGYCHLDRAAIVALIGQGKARDLVTLGGNFVIVARRQDALWIATSAYGVVPYFYCHRDVGQVSERFHHGASVIVVQHAAGLDWHWDDQALADLFCVEHLTGDASLHRDIRRCPPGSLLHWDGQRLTFWQATWSELHQAADASHGLQQGSVADQMVGMFSAELARCDRGAAVLSASGGFDSRVLLAGQLAAGHRPLLLVMGQPTATDRLVTEAIGRRFDLTVRSVELAAPDYLAAAQRVTQATNGTKPLAHWHTYIYPAKGGLTADDCLLVGSNGEMVRSFFYDQGIKSRLAEMLPGEAATQRFWRRNLWLDVAAEERSVLRPGVMAHLEEGLGGQAARFARFGAPEGGSANMMQRLDRFYLQQRVRHFIGNGLALYGETTAWRTPFLSIPWVAAATRLPRSWKLGSNWHRHAIDRLCPALLDFPEERVADHMARRAPMLYWHRRRRQQPVVPYVDYRRLLSQPDILALLADHASAIDDVLPVASQRQLIDAIRNGQRGHRLFSILTSLAIWRWNAKQA